MTLVKGANMTPKGTYDNRKEPSMPPKETRSDQHAGTRFLFELLCIPRLKSRLQCFVFILEFNARLHDLSENVEVRGGGERQGGGGGGGERLIKDHKRKANSLSRDTRQANALGFVIAVLVYTVALSWSFSRSAVTE